GRWTLERLEREVNPGNGLPSAAPAAVAASADRVQVLQQIRIQALDISVVRGGGPDVAKWAEANGFALTPDTPRVMQAYSSRGAVFALARFDNTAAARTGLVDGEGQ